MKRLAATLVLFLAMAAPAFAHALDAYLQAALIRIEENRIALSLRLVPGVAVFGAVIKTIDTNQDGVISRAEGDAYAAKVVNDLTLTLDGRPLEPHIDSVAMPPVDEMKQGLGEIRIALTVPIQAGSGNHVLAFQNRHQSPIAAYLVNSLVPTDRSIALVSQQRSYDQSSYHLTYRQDGAPVAAATPDAGGFSSMFRLGLSHIAEGTDHLLFLLTLILPAPLFARAGRWVGPAGMRHSLVRIIGVVTAFTIGHSISLALAAYGVVSVPARPVEVLIALSILISACHALRPIFPGREAFIAAFFGLIHGLAFAAALAPLGLSGWERLTAIAGFNLGIEAMQLTVIAATLPSLLLFSRSSAYGALRIGGACLAGLAALGWIAERLTGSASVMDRLAASLTDHAVFLAAALFLTSLVAWRLFSAARPGESQAR